MTSNRSSEDAPWLVADVGSTNARFGLARPAGDSVAVGAVATLPCAEHAGLAEAIEAYLGGLDGARPRVAAIAVAAPPTGDRITLTNHPWSFSVAQTRRRLGLDRLDLLNDFTALALSLPSLTPEELERVGEGTPEDGAPLAVIGPGTGLGVSGLIRLGDRRAPLAGEGGHAAFAPATDREIEILRILRRRYGHVSWERVLCGPGLVNLYESLAELAGRAPEPLSPEMVTERGQERSCPLCAEALEIFCGALGTAAGDLALTLGARGGVYIGGGIVPKLGGYFRRSPFRRRFEDKGRFADYLAAIPSYVITAPHPALIGAGVALLAPAGSP